MNEIASVSRTLVKRPWSDVEPKIVVALFVGFLAIIALIVAGSLKIELPKEVYMVVPVTFSLLAGYFTTSVGSTIVYPNKDNQTVVEQHTGNVETTFTAPTAVQAAPAPAAQSFTNVLNEGAPTSMYPPSERAANIMQQLGNRTGSPFPADPNVTERLDPGELH